MPLIHRGGSGVVLKSGDGDLPLLDPDDPFDDANVDLRGVEDAALLDVQLEVAGDVALGALTRRGARIAADEANPSSTVFPLFRDGLELGTW
jgi:hypothetical protein